MRQAVRGLQAPLGRSTRLPPVSGRGGKIRTGLAENEALHVRKSLWAAHSSLPSITIKSSTALMDDNLLLHSPSWITQEKWTSLMWISSENSCLET
jgi:hypothetical protein